MVYTLETAMKAQCVDDLMVREVRTVRSDADVHELEKLLLKEKIHGVPVVDPDGRLVGVVSQTDLLSWHFMEAVDGATVYQGSGQRPPRGLRFTDIRTARVEQVMSPVVHCICPDQPVTLAAARMIDRKVHRLIVVDEKAQVLGIVSAADLLRAIPEVEAALEKVKGERILYPDRPET
jgi:CBS-domain-containing membrane protein